MHPPPLPRLSHDGSRVMMHVLPGNDILLQPLPMHKFSFQASGPYSRLLLTRNDGDAAEGTPAQHRAFYEGNGISRLGGVEVSTTSRS